MSPEYVAGFFDGEGTFHLSEYEKKATGKFYPSAKVLLAQSGDDGKKLLLLIQSEYGGQFYTHLKAGSHKATKDAYKLYWRKEEAIALIKRLLPHLILKKNAARAVLQYLTRNNDSGTIQDDICS